MNHPQLHAQEWQFDGLVGPTHNYAGLAHGNLAAQKNAGAISNPRAAAIQGIEKMEFVASLGVPQAFLPPHPRPMLSQLRALGFNGPLGKMLEAASAESPALVSAVYSSSFMWTANAATVTPSCDSADQKVHFTPANMISHYHRGIESEFCTKILKNIFHNERFFTVHNALPSQQIFGDEGAANHMVECLKYGEEGTHIFVYGESHNRSQKPLRFPARQHAFSSAAIARTHKINQNNVLLLQQSPAAIDQGVFHNDVIAMNTTQRMIVHAESFVPEDQQRLRDYIKSKKNIGYREILPEELTVAEAVSTYFFNSQLIELLDGRFILIAPQEAETHPKARALLYKLKDERLLSEIYFRDLRESMRNGGGPACLRLRVVLTPAEAAAIHQGVVLNNVKIAALKQWVTEHYRDRLSTEDLRDPSFVGELKRTYFALEQIIEMPGFYRDAFEA